MTKLEEQILKSQRRIAAAKEKQKRQKSKQLETKKKNARPSGRPRLNPELIARARKMARTLPLPDVALRLDISRRSLLNYGITRNAMNLENALEAASKAKSKK